MAKKGFEFVFPTKDITSIWNGFSWFELYKLCFLNESLLLISLQSSGKIEKVLIESESYTH